MSAPDPKLPGPWPDALAAYVDGELAPEARAAVERWLAAHPRAMELICTQMQLSPENWPLWQRAEPPLPTEDAWADANRAIGDALDSHSATSARAAQANWWRKRGTVAAGLAAAVLLIALGIGLHYGRPVPNGAGEAPEQARSAAPDDPLAGIAVLPMATNAEVDIHRVAGNGVAALPIGDPPFAGPMTLASEGEIELRDAKPHPAWPGGKPRMTMAPGDAPMIYAASLR